MGYKRLRLGLLVILFTVTGCNQQGNQPSVNPEENYQPSIIIQIPGEGELMYRPNRESDYTPASLGMKLDVGNWLWQKNSEPSKIRCAKPNSTSPEIYKLIPKGEHTLANLGCPLIAQTQSQQITPRGGENLEIPFILSPRRTAVVNPRPQLRWNAVSGITHYTVSLEDQRVGKGKVWTKELGDRVITHHNKALEDSTVEYIEMDYPADVPALEAGVDYLIIVTTQEAVAATASCRQDWEKPPEDPFKCITSSTKDQGKGLGFYLLDKNKAQQIQELVTSIRQELDGIGQALALAHLYQENNLLVDAVNTLESSIKQGNQNTGIYSFLGDLYQEIQLTQLATARYTTAIDLAKASNDLVGQATAQFKLAEVLAKRGLKEEAIQMGTEAKETYTILGDTRLIRRLETKLSQWQ